MKIPTELIRLRDETDPTKATYYKSSKVPWVLEIQFFLDFNDSENYNSETKELRFATNSDGDDLYINLEDESLEVLQEEFKVIEGLGITIFELLEADKI